MPQIPTATTMAKKAFDSQKEWALIPLDSRNRPILFQQQV